MAKRLLFGNDLHKEMIYGIDQLEKAVTITLGPKGQNVILDNGTSHPVVTKDGVSVARQISVKEKSKNVGITLVKEAAEKVNAISGDGTTTTILLASELCKAGLKLSDQNYSSTDIQHGMDYACEDVIKALDKYTTKISGIDDVKSIATVSANNDEKVGQIIAEVYEKIGDDGIINVVDSHVKDDKTTYQIFDGLKYEAGLIDSRLTNSSKAFVANDAYIMIIDKKVEDKKLLPIVNLFISNKKPLVLLSTEIDDNVVSAVVNYYSQSRTTCNITFIKPLFDDEFAALDRFKDIAAATGSKIILADDIDDIIKDNLTFEDIVKYTNQVGKVNITKQNIMIYNPKGNVSDIDNRIKEIETEISTRKNDVDVGLSIEEEETMKRRIASLNGSIATIFVGGLTTSRIKELKDRYEDAVHAVNAAIADGIVPGGGAALLRASHDVLLNHKEFDNRAIEEGYKAVLKVCRIPARRIISSITDQVDDIIFQIENANNLTTAYDAKKEVLIDNAIKSGVIDPVSVEKNALKFSVSVAGIVATAGCVVMPETDNISLNANDSDSELIESDYGNMRL